jgi:hypothetical protein
MKLLTQLISVVALSGWLPAQLLHASLITGTVNFTGTAALNSGSAATATEVIAWNSVAVSSRSGTFAAVAAGTPVAVAAPWNFDTSFPIPDFWNVAGFTFELKSSVVLAQGNFGSGGFVDVEGTGVVSGNGYTPTAFVWTFAAQDPSVGGYWVFSANNTSENTNGAPVMGAKMSSRSVVLTWTDPTFSLQSATNVAGPFSNVTGATSPYTNSPTGSQLFFRLKQAPPP